jgi:hypothetical protein
MRGGVIILMTLVSGCAWTPKPYDSDPMGRMPSQTAVVETAIVEPLVMSWPEPPTLPFSEP